MIKRREVVNPGPGTIVPCLGHTFYGTYAEYEEFRRTNPGDVLWIHSVCDPTTGKTVEVDKVDSAR